MNGPGATAPAYGVYVHFPFCAHRCPYCDFAVSTDRPLEQGRYLRAVLAELTLRAPRFAGLRPVSLYVGGGTPSLWDPSELTALVAALRARLGLPPTAEVTIEANPESLDRGRVAAWRAAGVNRVSIGVQSFDPVVLRKLGRRHSAEDAARAVEIAAATFANVSVDLIYGARHSTVATARADAARAAALGAAHVSAYALTLDREVLAEEVPFARLSRAGKLAFPAEEEVLAQARAVRSALRRGGLRRYEVSNFARPGFESVHNALYWAGGSYLGLGAGAVGCLRGEAGGLREANHREWPAWLEAVDAGRLPTAEEDRFDARADASERLMLALRTGRGAPLEALGEPARREVAALLRHRLAVVRGDRLVLTSRGLDLHSEIAARLI
ncbi:MAG TPA: radical SAM family heme chaperone HemW [Anaeromyxobacteraceae bacterium]|nr:radical SAM family heme chaperone HemW [Anaeromyxobacteraceae bacterium]